MKIFTKLLIFIVIVGIWNVFQINRAMAISYVPFGGMIVGTIVPDKNCPFTRYMILDFTQPIPANKGVMTLAALALPYNNPYPTIGSYVLGLATLSTTNACAGQYFPLFWGASF